MRGHARYAENSSSDWLRSGTTFVRYCTAVGCFLIVRGMKWEYLPIVVLHSGTLQFSCWKCETNRYHLLSCISEGACSDVAYQEAA